MSGSGLITGLHSTGNDSDSPYTFQELLKDVPLTPSEDGSEPVITCVDHWEGNLYIGASNGELLHFVSIPGERDDDPPAFILASRQEPQWVSSTTSSDLPGVQRILTLPSVRKACVISNYTLTFYTLPELSPAFGGKIKQGDCNFVGGVDEDRIYEEDEEVIIIICLRQRLRLIRIGEQARKVRDIELPGCLSVRRRGDLACVADGTSYSLIDVVNQRRNELFPVSSLPPTPPPRSPTQSPMGSPRPAMRPQPDHERQRPVSLHFPGSSRPLESGGRGHERTSSMSALPHDANRAPPDSPTQWPSRFSSRQLEAPPDSPARSRSPLTRQAIEGAMAKSQETMPERPTTPRLKERLRPMILSPTSTEFLLVTGTYSNEPGVGMFVNEDGDVSRGTLDFVTYPYSIMIDGVSRQDLGATSANTNALLIALTLQGGRVSDHTTVLEAQPIDSDQQGTKSFLKLPNSTNDITAGLTGATSSITIATPSVVQSLAQRRLLLSQPSDTLKNADQEKSKREDMIVSRFASTTTRSILYSGTSIWWLVRHPELLKLEDMLDAALQETSGKGLLSVNRASVEHTFNALRGRDPQDEIQFMTFGYIRQKAALLLLLELLISSARAVAAPKRDILYAQEALISSDIEPRVVLSMIPKISEETIEGDSGIWVPGGIVTLMRKIRDNEQLKSITWETSAARDNILPVLKGYLQAWRGKKGFGSIADESNVFKTVDAALLHTLLLLDEDRPSGPATTGSIRSELNELVDNDVDCFDRAVVLLKAFHRLYVLSRLYQKKKMTAQVLATWRSILDGDKDLGGELTDGETDIRKYLARIKDASLVKEYGTWLANRNPSLGVQIFADDSARVRFTNAEAVELLKAEAPNAVRYYLEFLVFTKRQAQYSSDLIYFYLDALISTLSETDSDAASALRDSYELYNALPDPKPTYMSFIHLNAPDTEWHHNRLRLIELLETTSVPTTELDTLSTRIKPHAPLLVPESIILASSTNQHDQALELLIHSLADFDTAIRYCLTSGTQIFAPAPPSAPSALSTSLRTQSRTALFHILLKQILTLPDPDTRLQRASELLERFGAVYFDDVAAVLALVPDEWPVAVLQGFLASALRALVSRRREAGVRRALAAGENLAVGVKLVKEIERRGPVVQSAYADGQGKSWADSGYGSLPMDGGDGVEGRG